MTPVGTARYPKLDRPDTKGEYADNKYKTELVLDAPDEKDFKRFLQDKAKEIAPELKTPHLPIRTDKKDGTVSFIFKSQNKPIIVDAKRNPLPPDTSIRGGSLIRIAFTLTNYEKGLSLWLDAVQVVDLVEGTQGANAFTEVEGYVAEAASESRPEVADGIGTNRFAL